MKNTISFTLRLDEETHKLLIEESQKEKRSINNLLIYIIWEYFKNKKAQK